MSNDFLYKECCGVSYFTSSQLEETGLVKHFFSTRLGGKSSGAYKSLNLGIYTDDNKEDVEDNMDLIFKASNMSLVNCIYLRQIHSSNFRIIEDKYDSITKGQDGDAIITKQKCIPIGVFTADCVPILILDKGKGIIASVHAGWKGTYNKISYKVINYMIDNFGTAPSDIIAAIGPSIGPCCFQVGDDVARNFKFTQKINEKFYVDLWSENIYQITDCGVPKENIDTSKLCSKCNREFFYSYRRDDGNTGRMGSFIELI
jgi:YfiH family protein